MLPRPKTLVSRLDGDGADRLACNMNRIVRVAFLDRRGLRRPCGELAFVAWSLSHQDGTTSETKFAITWNKEANVRWRTPLPEPGNSSPIVLGTRVYVTQAVHDGQRRTVML